MVFVAWVVNQLRVMSDSAVQGFHELIYLVSGDRRRTNFPVNVRRTIHMTRLPFQR